LYRGKDYCLDPPRPCTPRKLAGVLLTASSSRPIIGQVSQITHHLVHKRFDDTLLDSEGLENGVYWICVEVHGPAIARVVDLHAAAACLHDLAGYRKT
jgi:hypothetical protein